MRFGIMLRWCSILGMVAMAALGLVACSGKSASGDEEAAGGQTAVAEISVTRVARADISQTLAITGTVAALPNQDVQVSSLVPGRIASMAVGEGDRVSQGQVLAQIDDRPYKDQLRQGEAAVEQAQAQLENAKLQFARNQNLFERGIAARKDLEDSRMQQSVAQAALSHAEAALALARLQLSRTEIRSPLTGTVVRRFRSVGEQVDGSGAQPIFEVAALREVELFGNVPAVYLGKIHVGQTLSVSTEALPGKTFPGRVVAISPAVDPSTDVGLVRIRMANPGGLLRLGMFLSVQVPVATHVGALVVPPEAIYRDEQGRAHVYRVEGNLATAVLVELGIETQSRVELLSGVREGETVILTGGYGLGAKAKVEVKR